MSTNYGMNGAKGRAKTLRSIRAGQRRRAAAAGIDPNNRAAVRSFVDAELAEVFARINSKVQS